MPLSTHALLMAGNGPRGIAHHLLRAVVAKRADLTVMVVHAESVLPIKSVIQEVVARQIAAGTPDLMVVAVIALAREVYCAEVLA